MQNEKIPAILTHATGMLTTFLGPLVLYFVFRNRASPWLREHLDESVNYWILVSVLAVALTAVAVFWQSGGLWPFLVAIVLVLVALLFGIISIVKASLGKASHYPLNVKMIK